MPQEVQDLAEIQVQLDRQDHKDLQALQDLRDLSEIQDQQGQLVNWEQPEPQVARVQRVVKDLSENEEQLVELELVVIQAKMVSQVKQAHLDLQDLKVPKDQQDNKALQAGLAQLE